MISQRGPNDEMISPTTQNLAFRKENKVLSKTQRKCSLAMMLRICFNNLYKLGYKMNPKMSDSQKSIGSKNQGTTNGYCFI